MDMKNMNILGIIGIIGTLILIIGVFLTWGSYENLLGETVKVSGLDFFNKTSSVVDGTKYTWVPLVALICGIISLLLMVLPTFMNTDNFQQINNILGIVALVMALVVIIFGILFITQEFTYDWGMFGKLTKKFTDFYSVGIGYWLVMIGAVITFIGGIMPILKNKGIIKC